MDRLFHTLLVNTEDVPPSFLASAGTGDRIHAIWANQWYTAMLEAAVPNIEMHLYGNGVHGSNDGIPLGNWKERFVEWFDDLGFLGPAGAETKAAAHVREFATNPAGRRTPPGQVSSQARCRCL
jgi:endo-1,4-beta-xylanase